MNKLSARYIESDYAGEADSNRYVTRTMIFGAIMMCITCILNELGFYHVDKMIMHYATILICMIALFFSFFIRNENHAALPATKYIVLGGVTLLTLIDTTVVGTFSTPLQVYPLVVGTHYKSKRVNFFAIMGSCVCAFFGPVIGIKFGLWDAKYYLWLLNILTPDYMPMPMLLHNMDGVPLSGPEGVVKFISIPTVLNVFVLGVLSFTVNISRRKRSRQEIEKVLDMQDKVLYSMADIIENRDYNTGGHVKRTSYLVKIMARHLRENPIEDLDDLFYEALSKGAPLHDIGKITVSDTILCKPTRLTEEEFNKIKAHPVESERIIRQVLTGIEEEHLLEIVRKMAKYHHEKFDGTGYPSGLKGDDIPIEARIMAIADVYDALVSERCYKSPMTHEAAFDTIIKNMGTHFDPKLEPCFRESFDEFVKYYL